MSYNGERKRQYQRDWLQKRRLEWIQQNGPCQRCGSTDDLQVDHVNRRKEHGGIAPGTLWSRSLQVRQAELAKCQVLCRTCHEAKSANERDAGHGASKYRAGCRCTTCTVGNREKMRQFRASKKAA